MSSFITGRALHHVCRVGNRAATMDFYRKVLLMKVRKLKETATKKDKQTRFARDCNKIALSCSDKKYQIIDKKQSTSKWAAMSEMTREINDNFLANWVSNY